MKKIKTVVIVGGDYATWLCAAGLAKRFEGSQIDISVVSNSQAAHAPLLQSSMPTFIRYLAELGIDQTDFILKTQASYTLGARFTNTHEQRNSFFHTYDSAGAKVDGVDLSFLLPFFDKFTSRKSYSNYSLSAEMCRQGKFLRPQTVSTVGDAEGSILPDHYYSLNFDMALVERYFKTMAMELGVRCFDQSVQKVNSDDQGIVNLELNNGSRIEGDLYIDCSGEEALLIGKELHVEFESWREKLPCDRTITAQFVAGEHIPPFSDVAWHNAGWHWSIPSQNRVQKGFVYSSDIYTDEQALAKCLPIFESEDASVVASGMHSAPRIAHTESGLRRMAWKQNCVAIGGAAGYVEQLESTSIHLVTTAIDTLLQLFPSTNNFSSAAEAFNRTMVLECEQVRDFCLLHYHTANYANGDCNHEKHTKAGVRFGDLNAAASFEESHTVFWQYCRELPLPHSLSQRLDLYREQGLVLCAENELFQASSWYSVLSAVGMLPKNIHLSVEHIPEDEILLQLNKLETKLKNIVAALPSLSQQLQQLSQLKLEP